VTKYNLFYVKDLQNSFSMFSLSPFTLRSMYKISISLHTMVATNMCLFVVNIYVNSRSIFKSFISLKSTVYHLMLSTKLSTVTPEFPTQNEITVNAEVPRAPFKNLYIRECITLSQTGWQSCGGEGRIT